MVEMNKTAQETAGKPMQLGWIEGEVYGHRVVERGRSHCIKGLVNRCKYFVFYLVKTIYKFWVRNDDISFQWKETTLAAI